MISWMPASQKLNYLFQKHITKGVQLSDQHFSDKLGHATDHLRFYSKYGKEAEFTALELGSGWYPVVPVALFLGGAKSVTSIDISPLMTGEGIQETITKYLHWLDTGKLEKLKPFIKSERLSALKAIAEKSFSKEELLSELNLTLLIKDARNTGFETNSFDLVCSNNTYEHIYSEILTGIIKEFQRVVKPAGVNSHFIDMSDHFAHLDDSITIYNYLRFSEKQWRRIDNSVQPQNRLRMSDYEKMYTEYNIEILEKEIRPGSIDDLRKVQLDAAYTDYDKKDVAISHVHIVSSKKS